MKRTGCDQRGECRAVALWIADYLGMSLTTSADNSGRWLQEMTADRADNSASPITGPLNSIERSLAWSIRRSEGVASTPA